MIDITKVIELIVCEEFPFLKEKYEITFEKIKNT
jgi:hypothetical protein